MLVRFSAAQDIIENSFSFSFLSPVGFLWQNSLVLSFFIITSNEWRQRWRPNLFNSIDFARYSTSWIWIWQQPAAFSHLDLFRVFSSSSAVVVYNFIVYLSDKIDLDTRDTTRKVSRNVLLSLWIETKRERRKKSKIFIRFLSITWCPSMWHARHPQSYSQTDQFSFLGVSIDNYHHHQDQRKHTYDNCQHQARAWSTCE